MKMRATGPIRAAKISYISVSVALCALGIVFIAFPDISAVTIGRILGFSMIAFGIVRICGFLSKDLYRLAFQYDIEMGIIIALLGLITLLKPAGVMDFIAVSLGISMISDALFKIHMAFDSRKFGIKLWGLILTAAIFAGTAGILLIINPWEGAQAMITLLGVSLFLEGALNLCVGVNAIKIVKRQYPDTVEAEFRDLEDDAK